MEIVPHSTNGVNGGDERSIEDAMSSPFDPASFCNRCHVRLHGSAYRVSFMGEPTIVSTPLCADCFAVYRPSTYVYARRVEVRHDG